MSQINYHINLNWTSHRNGIIPRNACVAYKTGTYDHQETVYWQKVPRCKGHCTLWSNMVLLCPQPRLTGRQLIVKSTKLQVDRSTVHRTVDLTRSWQIDSSVNRQQILLSSVYCRSVNRRQIRLSYFYCQLSTCQPSKDTVKFLLLSTVSHLQILFSSVCCRSVNLSTDNLSTVDKYC